MAQSLAQILQAVEGVLTGATRRAYLADRSKKELAYVAHAMLLTRPGKLNAAPGVGLLYGSLLGFGNQLEKLVVRGIAHTSVIDGVSIMRASRAAKLHMTDMPEIYLTPPDELVALANQYAEHAAVQRFWCEVTYGEFPFYLIENPSNTPLQNAQHVLDLLKHGLTDDTYQALWQHMQD